jgi:hypothetical protein
VLCRPFPKTKTKRINGGSQYPHGEGVVTSAQRPRSNPQLKNSFGNGGTRSRPTVLGNFTSAIEIFRVNQVPGDGNCLFHSYNHLVEADSQVSPAAARAALKDHIRNHPNFFDVHLSNDSDVNLLLSSIWVNKPLIILLCSIYSTRIIIHSINSPHLLDINPHNLDQEPVHLRAHRKGSMAAVASIFINQFSPRTLHTTTPTKKRSRSPTSYLSHPIPSFLMRGPKRPRSKPPKQLAASKRKRKRINLRTRLNDFFQSASSDDSPSPFMSSDSIKLCSWNHRKGFELAKADR